MPPIKGISRKCKEEGANRIEICPFILSLKKKAFSIYVTHREIINFDLDKKL